MVSVFCDMNICKNLSCVCPSGHAHPEVLEGVEAGGGGGRFLVFLAHLLELLEDLVEPGEEDLEDANELAAVDEVDLGDGPGLEDAGEEADAGVVVAHLVGLLPRDHLLPQEDQQVHDDLAVELGQLTDEVQHEAHLLLLLDGTAADDRHDPVVHLVGHDRTHQLREELLHHPRVSVTTVLPHALETLPFPHTGELFDDLLLLLNRARFPEDALQLKKGLVLLEGRQQDLERDRDAVLV